MNPADWFGTIWGDLDGHVSIFAVDRDTGTNAVRWATNADEFAGHVAELAPTSCVWAGVATRQRPLGTRRGGIDDCLYVPGLWLDIDIDGPGHADHPRRLPADRKEARSLLDAFPQPPTLIVDTGGGIQPWWLLEEPAAVDEIAPVLERWAHTWTTIAEQRGVWLDPVWNVDRVLRVPGTVNRKVADDPRPVEIVAEGGPRWQLSDLDDHLADPPPPPIPTAPRQPYTGDERPGDTFNARHDGHEILTRLGFHSPRGKPGGDIDYVRPGKDRRGGTSATVYADDGHVTVWSTTCAAHWPALETGRPYDPYGLMVATSYGGDFAAASADLRREGYGADRPPPDLSWIPSAPGLVHGHGTAEAPAPLEARPLPGVDGTTPTFPLDTLPDWIADTCRTLAHAIQVPVDLPAHIALGCLATATAGKVRVHLANGSQWKEWTNLYLAVALPSGSGKSPVFSRMVGPIIETDRARQADAIRTRAEAEARRRMVENKMKKAEQAGSTDDAIAAAIELAEMTVPTVGPGLADDATPEALAEMMGANDGVLSILSPEGQVFDQLCGQYVDRGKNANVDVYLKAHSGDRLAQNRVKRGALVIERALLTIAVCTQPSVIDGLRAVPELASRGATARFMYAMPHDAIGHRDRSTTFEDAAVPEWTDRLTAICERYGATEHPVTVTYTPEAAQVWEGWDQATEGRCAPGEDLEHLAAWVPKLRSTLIRVAGLLAVCDDTRTVDVDILRRVFTIGDYWIEHAKVVHGRWGVGDTDLAVARKVGRWLVEQAERGRERVTFRDIGRSFPRALVDGEPYKTALPEPLSILIDAGWLTPEVEDWEAQMGRGKGSPAFRIGQISMDKLSGYSQESVACVAADSKHRGNVTECPVDRNKSVACVACVAKGGSENPSSFSAFPQTPPPRDTRDTFSVVPINSGDCHPGAEQIDALEPGSALFGGGPWNHDTASHTDR